MRQLLVIALVCGTILSCKKQEHPASYGESGIITLNAQVDGTPISYTSGADGLTAVVGFMDTAATARAWQCGFREADSMDAPLFEIVITNFQFPNGTIEEDFNGTIINGPFLYWFIEPPGPTPVVPTNKAVIIYRKPDGTLYYSAALDNKTTESSFELSNVTTFIKGGKKYRSADVVFDCIASDVARLDTIAISGSGTLLFGGI